MLRLGHFSNLAALATELEQSFSGSWCKGPPVHYCSVLIYSLFEMQDCSPVAAAML